MSVTFRAATSSEYVPTEGPMKGQTVTRMIAVAGTPELNFSNSNARHLLYTVDIYDDELCGQITDLVEFKRKLITAINSESARAAGVREGLSEKNFFDMGQTEAAVVLKLTALLGLADFAQKNNVGIMYC